MRRNREPKGTQAEFDRFTRRMDKRTQIAVRRLVRTGDVDQFADAFSQIVEDGHMGAVHRGRILAGDRSKVDAHDRAFATEISETQAEFIESFLDDIDKGRYSDADGQISLPALRNRTRYYLDRLRGTANEAFVAASDEDEDWFWEFGVAEHCDDCLEMHAASPLKSAELWTLPGNCETACRSKCKCRIRRSSDGVVGFAHVDLYEPAQVYELQPAATSVAA